MATGHRSFNHPHFYIGSVRDQAKFSISSCCAGRRTARFPTSGRTLEPGPAARNFATVEIGRATSELQSLMRISSAVFCLKKKKKTLTSGTMLKRVTLVRVRMDVNVTKAIATP